LYSETEGAASSRLARENLIAEQQLVDFRQPKLAPAANAVVD